MSVRRIRLFRSLPNGEDDPRVREAVLREDNAWLREENTRLELECEKLKQRYSAARAGLRDATGCETPSPSATMLAARQMEEERRHGQTPQQAAFNRGLAEGQRDRPPITNGRGNILDIRENVPHPRQGEIQRETADEYYERQMIRLQRDMVRKIRLTVVMMVMLSISVLLYFHPILMTWLLNWEIK
jgi:cell division protein FtsB